MMTKPTTDNDKIGWIADAICELCQEQGRYSNKEVFDACFGEISKADIRRLEKQAKARAAEMASCESL
jgi:hypothetical protein